MATGIAPVQETIPTRLFTEQNIGTIQITTADQASGVWFGNTSFEDDFAKGPDRWQPTDAKACRPISPTWICARSVRCRTAC